MAILSNVPDFIKIREDGRSVERCFFCDNEMDKGGFWRGTSEISVCKNCAMYLIDLYIDTLYDTDEEFLEASFEEKRHIINKIVEERLTKKEKIRETSWKYSSLKYFDLRYCSELGIIDDFSLVLDEEQFINILAKDALVSLEKIKGCTKDVKKYIKEISGEEPVEIGFFSIPDFDSNCFNFAIVAKIENNGSTYLICDDKNYLENIISTHKVDIREIYQ